MKTLLLFLLSLNVLAQEAGEPIWYGVIYLKDGRQMSTKGNVEFFGDEVRFYDLKDQLVQLPIKVVDVERTKAKNRELEGKLADEHALPPDDGSLFAKHARSKDAKTPESDMVITDKSLGNEDADSSDYADPDSLGLDADQVQAEAEEMYAEIMTRLETDKTFLAIVVVYGMLFAILGIISFATKCYLTFISFQDGLGWGFLMLFAGFTHWFVGCANVIIQLPLLGYIGSGFWFLQLIVLPIYIFKNCYARKWKLFFLWFLFFIWFGIGFVASFFYGLLG
ncbi:MAG: hypothetical protein H6510_11200 [Acidobacteria bacterium]|nr:hypothetical protein [Acidobacteriota bacterium]MCB9398371.1 hypothetical protein [Acidobacteriota bacterium]